MSLERIEKITCPKCEKESKFTFYDSINVSTNPKLKEKIFDRSFVLFHCPGCKYEAEVKTDVLYHDMKVPLMVYLNGSEKKMTVAALEKTLKKTRKSLDISDESDHYSIRLVRSLNDLIEKILLFDDGQNDKTIELLKLIIIEENDLRPDAEIYYSGLVTEKGKKQLSFSVYQEGQEEEQFLVNLKDIPEVIEQLEEMLSESSAGLDLKENKALLVNRLFALDILEKNPKK